MPAPSKVDWKKLKPHYCAGIRSIRDLARQFGCSPRAIVKHAAKHHWAQGLAEDIQKAEKTKSARIIAADHRAKPKKVATAPQPPGTEEKKGPGASTNKGGLGTEAAEKVRTGDAQREAEQNQQPDRPAQPAVAPPSLQEIEEMTDAEVIEANAEAQAEVKGIHRQDARKGRLMVGRLLAELDFTTSHQEELEADIYAETMGDRSSQRRAFMLKAISLPTRAGVMRDLATAMTKVVGIERQAFGIVDPKEPEKASDRAPLAERLRTFAAETQVETDDTGKVRSIRQRLVEMDQS
ncbi:hypothetical protein [Ferrovibrio sp.]|uniref:hypothetical protein n=1 Tax=Ferrovibrio sp. TaxID=1917215 RepID=UPI00311DABCD